MPNAEALLIRRAKQGDPAAFAEIYQQNYDAVYAYLFYRLGDPVAAEDLTAEVFLRLVEKISSFRYRGRPILAWLYTVARNLLTDHYRYAGPDEDLDGDAQRFLGFDAADDPAQAAERRLERECLGQALRRLKNSYQQVIVLRFVQGLSHAKTAAILGKTENATKVLQHRALRSLRRAIESEGCYEA